MAAAWHRVAEPELEEERVSTEAWGCPAQVLKPRYREEGVHMGEQPGLGGQSPSIERRASVRGGGGQWPHMRCESLSTARSVFMQGGGARCVSMQLEKDSCTGEGTSMEKWSMTVVKSM